MRPLTPALEHNDCQPKLAGEGWEGESEEGRAPLPLEPGSQSGSAPEGREASVSINGHTWRNAHAPGSGEEEDEKLLQ